VTRLKVVTYNVHKCRGMDGRTSAVRIAEVLHDLAPDVIALQEVLDHQAEAISSELGLPFSFGENRKHRGHGYGNVVFARFPVVGTRNYDLSVVGREARGCLRADLDIAGQVLHVFNVHLGTALIERRSQGRKLIAPELLADASIQAPPTGGCEAESERSYSALWQRWLPENAAAQVPFICSRLPMTPVIGVEVKPANAAASSP